MTTNKNKRKKVLVEPDDNRVNLSSVNKASKNSAKKNIFSGRIFKNKSGQKRDDEGKFTSGSGGLSSARDFNWKRAIPLVAIVALVGGFFVWQSFAATWTNEIQSAYQTYTGRSASAADVAYWTTNLDSKKWTVSSMGAFIQSSGEGKKYAASKGTATKPPVQNNDSSLPPYANVEAGVKMWYNTCLGRVPDAAGLAYWVGRLNKGEDQAKVYKDLEYQGPNHKCVVKDSKSTPTATAVPSAGVAKYNSGLTDFMDNRAFVEFAYNQLIGVSEPKGVEYWVQQLDSGSKTKQAVWNFMAQQPGAAKFAATKANGEYDWLNGNRPESGKLAESENMRVQKIIDKAYADLVIGLYEKAGYPEWNGKEPIVPYGGSPQLACQKEVWQLKNGISTVVGDTCYRLITNSRGKDVAAWAVTTGGVYENKISIDEALRRIRGVESSMVTSTVCYNVSDLLKKPECKEAAIRDLESYTDPAEMAKRKAQNEDYKKQSKDPEYLKQRIAETQNNGPKQATEEKPTSNKNQTNTSKANFNKVNTAATPRTALDMAVFDTPKVNISSAPPLMQDFAYSQVVLNKASEIEESVIDSIQFTDCDDFNQEINLNDEGDCVSYIQENLSLTEDPNLAITGVYDQDTASLVSLYQKSHNVKAKSGVVNRKTLDLLKRTANPTIHNSPFAPTKGSLINSRT